MDFWKMARIKTTNKHKGVIDRVKVWWRYYDDKAAVDIFKY